MRQSVATWPVWTPTRDDIEDVVTEITDAPVLFADRFLRMEHQLQTMADHVQALVFEDAARRVGREGVQ